MTTMETLAAVVEAIRAEKGHEAASWAALADLLGEEGDDAKAAAAARWLAFLAGLQGHRLAPSVKDLLGWTSASPVEYCRFLWQFSASYNCRLAPDRAGLPAAPAFRGLFHAVPYVGHRNVSQRQRGIYLHWWEMEIGRAHV